jgi:abortive infection bacteriophage resistance protein
MDFREEPLTPARQVQWLARKGMIFANAPEAEFHLQHINYHRLRPYWQAFERGRGENYHFVANLEFDQVMSLYRFDRKLRLLLLDAIERLEVSLRSRWSNEMSLRNGPLCLGQEGLFSDRELYRRSLDTLLHFYENSDDEFTLRFKDKYPRVRLPPIWICSEMLSLGQLAKWIGNARHIKDREAVARAYGQSENVLLPFLTHLTGIRNLCAHHARLWNRSWSPFPWPRVRTGSLQAMEAISNPEGKEGLYNTLVFLDVLLDVISPGNSWVHRLLPLIAETPGAPKDMGFPSDWKERVDWFGD